jgi:hypothetical protein
MTGELGRKVPHWVKGRVFGFYKIFYGDHWQSKALAGVVCHWQWPACLQTRRPTRGKLSLSTGETQLATGSNFNRRGSVANNLKARTDSDINYKLL